MPVRWTHDDGVLIVTIEHPPVNALSHAVREGLSQAILLLANDDALHAMLLCSTGQVFIGGADIREFSGPRQAPMLNEICRELEASDKPIVVAMHGVALGGGFEVALAAHYRVAAPAVELAFPEVLLGLLPGAGGTQRAPRLCGATLALDLMLSGRRLSAVEALRSGLIDRIADDPTTEALTWAHALAKHAATPRRARDGGALRDVAVHLAALRAAERDVAARSGHLFSPARIVACVEAAVLRPFDEGMAFESAAFLECLESPPRRALVHLFFAEREVKRSLNEGVDLDAIGARLVAARDAVETAESMHAMAIEGRAMLNAGIAVREIDIDVASVRFAGVPRHLGGVLFDASTQR